MHSFPDLITKLGGPAAVAKAANADPGAGRQWKARGNIPVKYWSAIIELATQNGVDGIDEARLVRMAVRPAKGRKRRAA